MNLLAFDVKMPHSKPTWGMLRTTANRLAEQILESKPMSNATLKMDTVNAAAPARMLMLASV